MQRRLRALFFDFDGVIVDSIHIKTQALQLLFQGCSPGVIQKVIHYHKQHGGISRVDKIVHAHANFIGLPIGKEELEKWSGRYADLVVEKVIEAPWIQGAQEFLQSTTTSTLEVFVISGTPEDELKYIINRRGITDSFKESLGSPVRKPAHIRNLLQKYELRPMDCVFVGDALTDYDAAKETGLHFVGIQGEVIFPSGTVVLEDCRGLQQALDNLFDTSSR
ncbi:MAG: hypothetical protein COA36_01850 [Desulfotalea sp.]|nr:MAG: hypothetical protein COA36_01850 [Desulfotalea sp.]